MAVLLLEILSFFHRVQNVNAHVMSCRGCERHSNSHLSCKKPRLLNPLSLASESSEVTFLQKCNVLAFKDAQCLLQSLDLCFARSDFLLIGLDLGGTHRLQLIGIGLHGIQLLPDISGVLTPITYCACKALNLRDLGLHLGHFCSFGNLALSCHLLIHGFLGSLCSFHLCKKLGKVFLSQLQEGHNLCTTT